MVKHDITTFMIIVLNMVFMVVLSGAIFCGQFQSYGGTMLFLEVIFLTALIAVALLAIHWIENITVDRFVLAVYFYPIVWVIFFVMGGISSLFLPLLFPHEKAVFLLKSIAWNNNAPDLFYMILIAIGLYTTFATPAGFVGVIGKNSQAVTKISRLLLCIAVIIGLIAMLCVDKGKAFFIGSIIFGIIYIFAKQHVMYKQKQC